MKKLISIFVILYSFSSFGQKIELQNLLDIDLEALTEEAFIKDWVDKYKLQYNKQSKSCLVNERELLTKPIASINFDLKRKVIKIELKEEYLQHRDNYPEWLKLSAQTFENLNNKFGKAVEFNISEDQTVNSLWNFKKHRISLHCRVSNSRMGSSNACHINLHLKNNKKNWSLGQHKTIPSVYFKHLRDRVEEKLKNYTPISNAEAQSISQKIKAIKPFKLNPKNVRIFYWPIHAGMFPYIDLSSLSFDSFLFLQTQSQKPLKDGFYLEVYFDNGLLKKVIRIEVKNGNQKESSKILYWYEKNKALKLIQHYANEIKYSYWIDYDNKGLISRVITYMDDRYSKCTLFSCADRYKEITCIEFGSEGNLLSLTYQQQDKYISLNKHHLNDESMNYIGINIDPITIAKKFQKLNLKYFLPNALANDNYIPNKPISGKAASLATPEFKKFIKFKDEYFIQVKQLMESQQDNPKELFKRKESSLYESVKITKDFFPIVLRQIGRGAVKLLTQDKKVHVLKLKQIFLDTYQLSQIHKQACEFKNITTGQTYSLELNKALVLGEAAYVKQAGRIHKITESENFFGYEPKIENGKISFTRNGLNYMPTEPYFSLTPYNDKESNHQLTKCKCYNDAKYDEQQIEDINIIGKPLNEKELVEVKTANIDLNYLLKFCNFSILLSVHKNFGDGVTGAEYFLVGQYALIDNKLITLKKGKQSVNVSYTANRLMVASKNFIHHKDESQSGYYIKKNFDDYYLLTFTPKNIWALSRLIDHYNFSIQDKNGLNSSYSFKTKSIFRRVNQQHIETPFQFKIDEAKKEILVDATLYDISFEDSSIYLVNKKSGKRLYLNESTFHLP